MPRPSCSISARTRAAAQTCPASVCRRNRDMTENPACSSNTARRDNSARPLDQQMVIGKSRAQIRRIGDLSVKDAFAQSPSLRTAPQRKREISRQRRKEAVAGLSFNALGDCSQRGVIGQGNRPPLLVSAGISILNPELKVFQFVSMERGLHPMNASHQPRLPCGGQR